MHKLITKPSHHSQRNTTLNELNGLNVDSNSLKGHHDERLMNDSEVSCESSVEFCKVVHRAQSSAVIYHQQ